MSYPIIGVLGGTFDPVHYGHLALADYLFKHLPLSQIQFIPCLSPPHRQPPQASPEHRLAMLKLAIANHPKWLANDIDYHRPAPSYMVDTLRILRQQQPHISWCLILGMDAFAQFNQWHQWQSILQLAHLIVVNRPGYELEPWSQDFLKTSQVSSIEYLKKHLYGGVLLENMMPNPSSATAIRHDLQSKRPPDIWLPPTVASYIQHHKLYKN